MNFRHYPDLRNRTLNQEDTTSLSDSTYRDIPLWQIGGKDK